MEELESVGMPARLWLIDHGIHRSAIPTRRQGNHPTEDIRAENSTILKPVFVFLKHGTLCEFQRNDAAM